MTNSITRRALVAGTVAAIATKANEAPPMLPDRLQAKLDTLSAALEGRELDISEVTGEGCSPHYRKGDLIFASRAKANPGDHVVVSLKSGKTAFGSLVHNDGVSLYLRGFNQGDKIAAVPFKTVKSWGRVMLSFRG